MITMADVAMTALFQDVIFSNTDVADDGSSTATSELIESFTQSSSIPIIHSWQEDVGCRIPHSRNHVIAKSNFDYIIMIDGDTVRHNDFVKDHLRFAKKHMGLFAKYGNPYC